MRAYNIFITSLKALAIGILIFQRFYFGPIGGVAGLCDGLVIAAILLSFNVYLVTPEDKK
jgi:hypothetical protein